MPACDSKARQAKPVDPDPPLTILIVAGLSFIGLLTVLLPLGILVGKGVIQGTYRNWQAVYTLFFG